MLDVTALDICNAGGHWGIKELDIVRGLEPVRVSWRQLLVDNSAGTFVKDGLPPLFEQEPDYQLWYRMVWDLINVAHRPMHEKAKEFMDKVDLRHAQSSSSIHPLGRNYGKLNAAVFREKIEKSYIFGFNPLWMRQHMKECYGPNSKMVTMNKKFNQGFNTCSNKA